MILASASAAVLVTAWVWVRFAHRGQTADELERQRRLDVNRRGRITSGRVIDFIEPEATPGAVPTNSIIACEQWCGIPGAEAKPAPARPSVAPVPKTQALSD